ncbi:hypothetical protein COO60DRAFT_1282895 [Scenedesmus sp. NREL 46B-D3]|nr:hypothetical protein COO60DRAFT_1282895 [Scenedesmus sp. NREL 46B-D3]
MRRCYIRLLACLFFAVALECCFPHIRLRYGCLCLQSKAVAAGCQQCAKCFLLLAACGCMCRVCQAVLQGWLSPLHCTALHCRSSSTPNLNPAGKHSSEEAACAAGVGLFLSLSYNAADCELSLAI